jgi:DNA-binding MarR family transcriptional regulator
MESVSRQGVRTWALLLRAHAAATRCMSDRLRAEHGLSINDYETLAALAEAPDRRMKRVDLARKLLLTASGVTRLLDGLRNAGLVERTGTDADQRVAYAQLTPAGAALLDAASPDYAAGILALESQLSDAELAQLGDILAKLALEAA